MSEIIKFEILNPTSDKNQPYYDFDKDILIVPLKIGYNYYVETRSITENNEVNYYILLGITKFNKNARRCHTDQYGKCKIKLEGEIRDFVIKECKERGNINVEYIESAEDYDIYHIS